MASFAINHGVPQLFCDAYIVNLSCVSSRLDFFIDIYVSSWKKQNKKKHKEMERGKFFDHSKPI